MSDLNNKKHEDINLQDSFDMPAIGCPLSGAYLIEASAGTGKTWTLTRIILRLLIEKKVPPQKIVATTFTRAAAKEIQERVFERVEHLYESCLWLQNFLTTQNLYTLNKNGIAKKIIAITQDTTYFKEIQKESQLKQKISDPINQYLMSYIISLGEDKFLPTLHYIKSLLTTVDKLFIGTIDSLAQKWLKEFVYEGEKMPDLIQNESVIIDNIIHEQLRLLHSQIQHDSPTLYELVDKKIFSDTRGIKKLTDNALQFFSAPIDKSEYYDDADFGKLLDNLKSDLSDIIEDLEQIDEFYQINKKSFYKRPNFEDNLSKLPKLIQILKQHGVYFFKAMDKDSVDFLAFINKNFDKKPVKDDALFTDWQSLNLSCFKVLHAFYQTTQNLTNTTKQYLVYHIATTIRNQLPEYLQNHHQTTFTITMMTLINALKNNHTIKQEIRYRYPVALIDEAQDISGEQATLIELIFLENSAKKSLYPNFFNLTKKNSKDDKGFLLLVGDPKQAIYRFRGSDVVNYNYIKSLGVNTKFKLIQNRRSNSRIIDILNIWFDGDFGDFGDNIFYDSIQATNQNCQFEFDKKTAVQIIDIQSYDDLAEHIYQVLQNARLDNQSITLSNIAVLADSHDKLADIKKSLTNIGIDAEDSKSLHVFNSEAAKDIYQTLITIVSPSMENLTAFLTSKLMCLSLNTAQQTLLTDTHFKNALLFCFKNAQTYWQKFGILKALDYILSQKLHDNKNIWQIISSLGDNGRYLTDIRQLLDILTAQQLNQVALIDWYKTQMLALENLDEYNSLPIGNANKVKLMTIHASKGLEFDIVYIVGLDTPIKKDLSGDKKLYPYYDGNQRRLSADGQKLVNGRAVKDLDKGEEADEKRRLGYVALTRAAEQVFVVNRKVSASSPMSFWGFDDGIPQRLAGHVDLTAFNQSLTDSKDIISAQPLTKIEYMPFDEAYPTNTFKAFYRASFTAFVKSINTPSGYINQYSDYQTADYDEVSPKTNLTLTNHDVFSARFLKGVKAGIFLHKVLENIPVYFDKVWQIDENLLSKHIDSLAYNISELRYIVSPDSPFFVSDNNEHMALKKWLIDIINSPFLSSNLSLLDLKNNHCIVKTELGFSLSVNSDFSLEKLIEVFNKFCDKKIMAIADDDKFYQLLNGEIDLVYESSGKYYIVDYKSNFLAKSPAGYTLDVLNQSMDSHYYWLQAVIYQVALHRLLSVRLKDYAGNEQKYLGEVEYVFLRGIDKDFFDNTLGRINWLIPFELIDEVDKLFGR